MNKRSMMLSATVVLVLTALAAATETPSTTITVDMASSGKTIDNKFSDINQWCIDTIWLDTAEQYPNDYFPERFPFVQRVQLFAATGGNVDRDLFRDPKDRTTTTDYAPGKLIKACENIVAKGLKPFIKLGWVPLKLSDDPAISQYFHTNMRPPKDYHAYYTYLCAVIEALKSRFGLNELKTWTWGVGTEYENPTWFLTADEKPESARLAYCKLYDFTVAALEDVLGAENVTVGAHSMSCVPGLWDEREFIAHCAKGTNLKTGKQGTKLDYVAISCYTEKPGFDPALFLRTVNRLREKALEVGLGTVKVGADEGRVLNGWDGRFLNLNEVQHPIQAAGDAKLFHLMVEHDVAYQSFWCLTTDYTTEDVPMKNHVTLFNWFGGIPVVSANLRNLAFRMAGSRLLDARRSGNPADAGDDVNALAGLDSKQKAVRILAYNFNRGQDAKTSEDLSICVEHVRPSGNERVTVRTWLLDEDHGNWWKLWQADVAARKIPPEGFVASVYALALPGDLTRRADVAFWLSRLREYRKAGALTYNDEVITPAADGHLKLHARLKPYAVALFEIYPVESERTR